MSFAERGVTKEGYAADLVLFDAGFLKDTASFVHPHAFPSGILHVMVNGEMVVEHGRLTEGRPGRIVHR